VAALPVSAAAARAASPRLLQQVAEAQAAPQAVAAAALAAPRALPAASGARSQQGAAAAVGSLAAAVPQGGPQARRTAGAQRPAAAGWPFREAVRHREAVQVDDRRLARADCPVVGRLRRAWRRVPLAASGSQGLEAARHRADVPADDPLPAQEDRPAAALRCLESERLAQWRWVRWLHWAQPRPAQQHPRARRPLAACGRQRREAASRPAPGPSPADGCRPEQTAQHWETD
jgi:hypothetical protein